MPEPKGKTEIALASKLIGKKRSKQDGTIQRIVRDGEKIASIHLCNGWKIVN